MQVHKFQLLGAFEGYFWPVLFVIISLAIETPMQFLNENNTWVVAFTGIAHFMFGTLTVPEKYVSQMGWSLKQTGK